MPNLVPIDLITGFLGSGKTTLLKYVLQHGLNGQKVAVIVNDFADFNVDGQILRGLNVDKMVELTSGCVCCSGLYKLGAGLQEIIETAKPTMIIIETSGAAAPSPVVSELSTLGYRTDAIITVVDVEHFLQMKKLESVLTEQVEDADFIVLNKLDLVSLPQLKKVKRVVSRMNKRAHIQQTSLGEVDSDLLFATAVRSLRQKTNRNSTHHPNLESFVWKTEKLLDRARFEKFMGKLPSSIYRVKGFIQFYGESSPSLLNYICGRFGLEWLPIVKEMDCHTQIVFVGKSAKNHQSSILKSLIGCQSSPTQPSLWQRMRSK